MGMRPIRGDEPPRWWQLPWREIVAVVVGAAMLMWQTVAVDSAQPALVGAGLALIGVGGVGSAQRAIRRKLGENGDGSAD